MTVPSPAELCWRVSWLAGTAVPPPPELDLAAERRRAATEADQRAEAARRQAARVQRDLRAVYGVPGAQVGRYAASLPRSWREVERQVEATNPYRAETTHCALCARQAGRHRHAV